MADFFYRYIVPYDDRLSIKDNDLVTRGARNLPTFHSWRLVIPAMLSGKQHSPFWNWPKSHSWRDYKRDFEVQNGGLFTRRHRRYIKVMEVALWWVVSLHLFKVHIITYASLLDENYRSLSIIPRVIDSAAIVVQQSKRDISIYRPSTNMYLYVSSL